MGSTLVGVSIDLEKFAPPVANVKDFGRSGIGHLTAMHPAPLHTITHDEERQVRVVVRSGHLKAREFVSPEFPIDRKFERCPRMGKDTMSVSVGPSVDDCPAPF